MKLPYSKSFRAKLTARDILYGLIVALPVLIFVFKFSILNRHGIFLGEDWGQFAQTYEAARQSILRYHQFPWWNPWMNGGQPLFANPQFGLFSIQMLLVLVFGTVSGLHYSMLVYFMAGFLGIYRLLQRLGSDNRLMTVLLSYIWIFSTFTTWHLGGGHLTFSIYLIAPWALLTILNIRRRRGWLWFGLVISFMILSAAHYLTIETMVICGVVAFTQIIRILYKSHPKDLMAYWPILKPYAFAVLLILILCGMRLFYTFQFIHEYPRLEALDAPESLRLFITSVTFRRPIDPLMFKGNYGWVEYADYFGIITIVLFSYLLLKRLENIKSLTLKDWFTIGGVFLGVAITVGSFVSFSPYSLLHHLPIFNQMRVPSRFICWVVLAIIIFLIKLPKKPLIFILLTLSAIDVFAASYPIINYDQKPYVQEVSMSREFQQYEFYQTTPDLGQIGILNIQNFRLLRATQQNSGEVYGYEPILNIGEYYYLPGTTRCGINKGCSFVLTHNAKVTYWSPHKITLYRTEQGPIKLNMNPGKVWKINGANPFANYRILELNKDFLITDPNQNIDIEYSAKL